MKKRGEKRRKKDQKKKKRKKQKQKDICAHAHTVGHRQWDKDSGTEAVRKIGAESVRCWGSAVRRQIVKYLNFKG